MWKTKERNCMTKELEVALKDFLAFGKPCEGSFRYHDAWKKLQEAYYFSETFHGFNKGEIACLVSKKEV